MPRNTKSRLKQQIKKLKKEMREKEELDHNRMVRMVKAGYEKDGKSFINEIDTNSITKRWETRKKVTPKKLLKQKKKLKSPTGNRRSDETIFIERSYYFQQEMKKKDEQILQLKSKNNDKCNKRVEKADKVCMYISWLLEETEGPRRVGRADDIKSYTRYIAKEMYELRCELVGARYVGRNGDAGSREWRPFY